MSTASLPTKTRVWVVAKTPGPDIDINQTFQLREVSLFNEQVTDWDHAKHHILLKTKWFSNDPAQRTWIAPYSEERHYTKPAGPGDIMPARTMGEVIYSTHEGYKVGDRVAGFWGWREYYLVHPDQETLRLEKVPPEIDAVDSLALGMMALTAYAGLINVGKAKPKDTVVISGAAGATGSIAVQLAKNVIGCKRVIGVADSEDKCKILREICNVDIALNSRSPSFEKDFEEATPEYIDLYFDNVGTQLDMAVRRIAKRGRVVTCGAIGFADKPDQVALTSGAYSQIIFQEAKIEGFVVYSYREHYSQMTTDMRKWATENRLNPLKTLWPAKFEEIPQGMMKLLQGEDVGKLVTCLKE